MSENTVLLLPHQERFIQSPKLFTDIRWHFLLAGYGAGKALPVDTIIPTPNGYKRFGDIKVGDKVFAANGNPTTVTGVFPQGMKDAYKVTFSDGRSAVCCREHLWGVYYYSHSGFKYKVIELDEILKKGVRRPDARYTKAGGKPRYWIPSSPICQYPSRKVPADPYVLGSFIGNGCLTCDYLTISSNDEWQVATVASKLGFSYKRNSLKNYNWSFKSAGHLVKTSDVIPKELCCCLAGEKFIPEIYKVAGFEQRKELLQGLFDTDGSVDNSGNRLHVTYSTTSKRLADDVREVLLSLGIVSTIRLNRREGKNDCYVLSVNCAKEQKAWLFSLPRKLERITSFKRADKRDYSRVAIYSIEKLPQQMDMQCIMVDDPSHLFLTEEHIVTHNTRSLAIKILDAIQELDGDKDEGGLYAKLIVGGYTYAHLEQTLLVDFRAYLDNSKTPYHEDTKNHVFTVGTVQVFVVQLLEPGKIFGQSCYAAYLDEADELPEDVMIEAMKSVSQRIRQIMPNHRSPYIMAASTAQGMKGFYRLYCHYKKSGIGFVLTRARTQDNWYLPKEYILDLWKNFTETERKVYMEGAFLSVTQGRAIPGFDWDRNFIPEDDDFTIMPGDRVYWGQDFNCLVGTTLVTTIHGDIPIRDIRPGDYVLTRKGFKKVLTSKCQGVKIVYDFGALSGTKDHLAITPQGDLELWKAKNFYCLREQNTSEYRNLRTIEAKWLELKELFMMTSCGEDTLMQETKGLSTSQDVISCCTGTFIRSFTEKYLKTLMSTTKTDTTITGLKILYACLKQNTLSNTKKSLTETLVEKFGSAQQRRFQIGITRLMDRITIQNTLKEYGVKESLTAQFVVSIVEEILKLTYARRSVALSAGLSITEQRKLNIISDISEENLNRILMLSLKGLVLSVENRLSEQLQQNIAKSISVIGSVPATNEREAEVYDIEVEDAHEFFANGILVHNCGYNRGSVWVARGSVLHCVKYYDFPDPGDSPDVVRYDFPEQDIFWLPDVTIKDQYPHYARALRKNDIHIIHRSKSPLVEDSCFLISKLCLQGRIIIHNGAREVAEAFSTASRDKDNKIPKGVGPNSPIHAIDGARYVCSYLALVLPEFRDLRRGIMSHLASFRAGAEEMETRFTSDLGAGYHRYEGADFRAG